MKRITLIGTVLPYGNKGDEAIYRTSIGLLRKKYPNYKLTLAPSGFTLEPHYLDHLKSLVDEIIPHPITFFKIVSPKSLVTDSASKFSRLLKFSSYKSSPYLPALVKYIKTNKTVFMNTYEDTDLFIILGHPVERIGLPTYLASYFFPKQILKKSTVAFPLSFSMLKYSSSGFIDKMIRSYVKTLLEQMDIVLFREKRSLDYFLHVMRANTNSFLSADTAFLLENAKHNSVTEKLLEQNIFLERPAIAVCLRNDYFTAYSNKFSNEDIISFFRGIAALLDNLIEKENLQILFVPTVPESDYALSKYVHNLMKNKNKCYVVNTKCFDCTEVKLLLGQMDFLISMRIHATILAGSNNVPSLSILPSYDFKSVGIMNDLGLSDYFLNLMDLSSTHKLLPVTIKLLHNNLDDVVYNMKERTPTIKSRAESAVRMLDYVL